MSLDVRLQIVVDTGGAEPRVAELFSRNITHNVSRMWVKAGMYAAIYENHGKRAGDMLPELEKGVAAMEADRDGYVLLEPINRRGTYEGALAFAIAFRNACREHPKAEVRSSA